MESENEKLSSELCNQQHLIQSLTTDLRYINSTYRSCMIYELYQRFRINISNDMKSRGILREGKKFDALLEEIRRNKVFTDEKILYWIVKFEGSPEARVR